MKPGKIQWGAPWVGGACTYGSLVEMQNHRPLLRVPDSAPHCCKVPQVIYMRRNEMRALRNSAGCAGGWQPPGLGTAFTCLRWPGVSGEARCVGRAVGARVVPHTCCPLLPAPALGPHSASPLVTDLPPGPGGALQGRQLATASTERESQAPRAGGPRLEQK